MSPRWGWSSVAGGGVRLQGNPEITRAVEDLRRQTFALIERIGTCAVTPEDQRAVVDLQRVAYDLGKVESQLRDRHLRAA